MRLVVNGKPREYNGPPNLAALLDALEVRRDRRGLAVALNDTVVQRERFAKTNIEEGDRVEVIEAVQGG